MLVAGAKTAPQARAPTISPIDRVSNRRGTTPWSRRAGRDGKVSRARDPAGGDSYSAIPESERLGSAAEKIQPAARSASVTGDEYDYARLRNSAETISRIAAPASEPLPQCRRGAGRLTNERHPDPAVETDRSRSGTGSHDDARASYSPPCPRLGNGTAPQSVMHVLEDHRDLGVLKMPEDGVHANAVVHQVAATAGHGDDALSTPNRRLPIRPSLAATDAGVMMQPRSPSSADRDRPCVGRRRDAAEGDEVSVPLAAELDHG